MPDPHEAMLRLALTPGIGARSIARLLDRFPSAWHALEASENQWKDQGVAPRLLRSARSTGVSARAAGVVKRCSQLGVDIVTLGSPEYPPDLATIFDPPPVLYLRGRLPSAGSLRRSVAIVGTRKPSNHGLSFAYRLAAELSRAGAVVVSGLAMGVDAEAHRAVVDGGGVGIGVLAGGLDSVHPPANRELAERLCERGCLLSEHPPGTSPRPAYFVGRNRLVSGLSRLVAVVEAGTGSGALLTADFAVEQSRSVFVMPGRPGDPRLEGSLSLLRDGAAILLSSADIAAELGIESSEEDPLHELGDDGNLFSGGASFDAILTSSGLSAPRLLALLSRLEMAGRIRRGTDGFYYRL